MTVEKDRPVGDFVWDHYIRSWSTPIAVNRLHHRGTELVIGLWTPEASGSGVFLYATAGYGRPSDEGHLLEFVVGLHERRDDIATALADLWASGVDTKLGHGTTVDMGRPLWNGAQMQAFLLLRQRSLLAPLNAGPCHIEYLKAVPIYEREGAFKRQHGIAELLDRWRAAQIAYWIADRPESPLD